MASCSRCDISITASSRLVLYSGSRACKLSSKRFLLMACSHSSTCSAIMGFCGPLEGGGMGDLLSCCLVCMSALIPHPLYQVYEKFITTKLSRHDRGNAYPLTACAGRKVT